MGRPFSQQLDGVDPAAAAAADAAAAAAAADEAAAADPPPVVAAALDTCDMAPGLRAPICTPDAEPVGLSDGAFRQPLPADNGDCALIAVVVF